MNKRNTIIVIILVLTGLLLSRIILRLSNSEKPVQNANKTITKVVTYNPAVVEVIYELHQEDKLAGISDFCSFPPQIKEKIRVGASINPNFEMLRALEPDLVIIMGENPAIINFCKSIGCRVLRLDMYNVDGLLKDIGVLGEELGCQAEAEKLISKIQTELEFVKNKTSGLERPKVFLSFFRSADSLTGLSTVGGGTHLNNLIEIAGGENIFKDIELFYPKISKESLLKLQPDIIIEPKTAEELAAGGREKFLAQWKALGSVPAVKNGRIYFPDADLLLKPGPRVGKAAYELGRIIHPEVFN